MTLLKRIRYVAEAALARSLFALMRLLPLDVASSIGGWVARTFAPLHKTTRIARQNLRRAMPELSEAEINRILTEMWDNMGRTIGEYPHLPSEQMSQRITIHGLDVFEEVKASEKGALFVAGHLGNWEIAPKTGYVAGVPLTLIYRPANNPMVDGLIRQTRLSYAEGMYPKGRKGALEVMKALKAHKVVGMLTDQKMNDGIPVPFFGRDAMTAPATAQLALKYDVPIYLARVVRNGGAHFDFFIEKMDYIKTDDTTADVLTIMTQINQAFEGWIRQHPAQWFWMHNRWPKD